MNIYVGNISFNANADDLRKAFEQYGEVASANVITDRATGRSKGFGFVEMNDDNAGHKAIEALNGSELLGRKINVNEAHPREDTNRRPGGGGGGFNRNRQR